MPDDINTVEKLLGELSRLVKNYKNRQLPKGGGEPLPPDIQRRLLKLRNMIDMFRASSADAIKGANIPKDVIATSIAHPELLTPANKRIVAKANELKAESMSMYKNTSELATQEQKKRGKSKKGKKTKEQASESQKRVKKFKSVGGSHWKPV